MKNSKYNIRRYRPALRRCATAYNTDRVRKIILSMARTMCDRLRLLWIQVLVCIDAAEQTVTQCTTMSSRGDFIDLFNVLGDGYDSSFIEHSDRMSNGIYPNHN